MISPASIAYVPPPAFGCSTVFLKNLRTYQTTYPLILFSDHDYGEGFVRLKGSPEAAKGGRLRNGDPNPFAINNFIFLTGLKIAQAHGVSHLLYLESDCRVMGDHWDKAMFDEHFNLPLPVPFSGTVVTYNPSNGGMESTRRWYELIDTVRAKGGPVPATYGNKGAADNYGTAVFVNGALGIYEMAWLLKLFRIDDESIKREAQSSHAWDMELGLLLWEMVGVDAYDLFGWRTSSFSSFGNVMTSLEERMEMLRSGKTRGIHQVKENLLP